MGPSASLPPPLNLPGSQHVFRSKAAVSPGPCQCSFGQSPQHPHLIPGGLHVPLLSLPSSCRRVLGLGICSPLDVSSNPDPPLGVTASTLTLHSAVTASCAPHPLPLGFLLHLVSRCSSPAPSPVFPSYTVVIIGVVPPIWPVCSPLTSVTSCSPEPAFLSLCLGS